MVRNWVPQQVSALARDVSRLRTSSIRGAFFLRSQTDLGRAHINDRQLGRVLTN